MQLRGSINYLAISRPDLEFGLRRSAGLPTELQLRCLRRIIRYLRQFDSWGVRYKPDNRAGLGYEAEHMIKCESDASWGNAKNGKSYSGSIVLVNNNPVVHKTSLQELVALSSTEAEVHASSDTARWGLTVHKLVVEFLQVWQNQGVLAKTMEMAIDNKSAVLHSTHLMNLKRLKHVHIRTGFLKDLIEREIFSCHQKSGKLIRADPLTKDIVSPSQWLRALVKLGMVNFELNKRGSSK
jgi:hypothetical protein